MSDKEKVDAVQRMQDFIKANLSRQIGLYELAEVSGYSKWYCSRIFKELTGHLPFEYIRMLRVSEAALVLRDSDKKVIDVAFDFVFDSHEGFTRAFSKEFGLSPHEYKRKKTAIKLFYPYPVSISRKEQRGEQSMDKLRGDHLSNSNGKNIVPIFTQVIERPARKLILKRGLTADNYFTYCEEVGCDVWGVLVSIKEAIYEPMGLWLPANMRRSGTSSYVQGVEVGLDYDKELPAGFEIITLKPCKMMIFQGPPFKDEEFEEAIIDLWRCLENFDPKIYGFQWDEAIAPRFQMEPQGYRGYIEGRPVKLLEK
ncbi:MAG: helix-turn-helix transcriptional regulator [Spirochaetales bacterium]|nr:helix-turn-helix transcriptional regulator [Spirochaetales bacterium]